MTGRKPRFIKVKITVVASTFYSFLVLEMLILKHLKYKKLCSVRIYRIGLTSFSPSNCTEKVGFSSFFYTQLANLNDVIHMQ